MGCRIDRLVLLWCVEVTKHQNVQIDNLSRHLNTNLSPRHVTDSTRDGFVLKWRICVEATALCWSYVLNWRICVELSNCGAEKEWPLCGSSVLKWRVCGSEGHSKIKYKNSTILLLVNKNSYNIISRSV